MATGYCVWQISHFRDTTQGIFYFNLFVFLCNLFLAEYWNMTGILNSGNTSKWENIPIAFVDGNNCCA